MAIKSEEELMMVLSKPVNDIMASMQKEVKKILDDYINLDTYGMPDGLPNDDYYNGTRMPTFQFRDDAFHFSELDQIANEITTELFYDWEQMEYDGDTKLHGNPREDLRSALADILNVRTSFFLGEKEREPFWDNFIEAMFSNKLLDTLFDSYIRKRFKRIGIDVIKKG